MTREGEINAQVLLYLGAGPINTRLHSSAGQLLQAGPITGRSWRARRHRMNVFNKAGRHSSRGRQPHTSLLLRLETI